MSIQFNPRGFNALEIRSVFRQVARELSKQSALGNTKWWRPLKIQMSTSPPNNPEDGAFYWDPNTKRLCIYHSGSDKWYRSNPFTPTGDIDGGEE